MINYIDEQEATVPPPQTPRSAKFRLSVFETSTVLFISLQLLLAIRGLWTWEFRYEPFSQGLDYGLPYFLVLYLSCFYMFVRIVRQNRRLFTNGIAVCATETFVGKVPKSFSTSSGDFVCWQYIVDGVEHTGFSPREQLPNSGLGDVFWVLHQKENPNFVRRWESFDIDGNLVHNDDENADTEIRISPDSLPGLGLILLVFVPYMISKISQA